MKIFQYLPTRESIEELAPRIAERDGRKSAKGDIDASSRLFPATRIWFQLNNSHELDQLFLVVAPDLGITEMRYDSAGNVVALLDPVGNKSMWKYDALNRVVSETDPDGQTRTKEYDEAGRLVEEIDRLGRKKEYTWTDAGRLESETWYDPTNVFVLATLGYTYYEDGRLHTASNDAGTYTFTYDDLGRVETIQDPNGITLTYGWNEADDLVSVTDSEGGLVESTYDEAHRLIERAQSGSGVESLSIQIDYDEEGRREVLLYDSNSSAERSGSVLPCC